ncbi:hypothetical protein C8R46DRAFT_1184986 [Mycena filopes]|nr:hypothetical protein C8R46DRAFT_1184986 [Mycena filopes]
MDGIVTSSLEFSFTGTDIYLFIAIPAVGTIYGFTVSAGGGKNSLGYPDSVSLEFITLDGKDLPNTPAFPVLTSPQYSYCPWSITNLANGPHTVSMNTGPIMLDSIVYTSNDPDPSSSDTPTLTIDTSSSTSATPSVASSHTVTSTTGTSTTIGTSSSTGATPSGSAAVLASHNKPPIGAIAGGVVGGAALILALVVGWMLSRRAKHAKERTTPAMEESASPPDNPLLTQSPAVTVPTTRKSEPASQDAVSAEQFRLLQEEVRQLRQQRAGSSTAGSSIAGSDTASLGRSLSIMKREQTRALVEHGERGDGVTDTLVHTDSGLRLTAGRTVDELPPTYVAD